MTGRSSYRRWLAAWLLLAPTAFSAPFATTTRDLAAAAAAARAAQKPLAVLFQLVDCSRCEQLKRVVLADAATAAEFDRRFLMVAVNLDTLEPLTDPAGTVTVAPEWAMRLHIVAAPALAFFDANGRLLYRHTGELADAVEAQLLARYVAEAAYEQQPFADYRRARRP